MLFQIFKNFSGWNNENFHFNYSSNQGGVARAANRIHKSLLEEGLESELYVNLLIGQIKKLWYQRTIEKGNALIKSYLSDKLIKKLNFENSNHQSISLFPSHWLKFINSSSADVIHLHWINSEMLSISDIGKIKNLLFGQSRYVTFLDRTFI